MRYRLLRSIAILAVLLFALWPVSVLAASDFPMNISGLEVFPGIPNGNIVYGDTFAGWVGGTGAGPGGRLVLLVPVGVGQSSSTTVTQMGRG